MKAQNKAPEIERFREMQKRKSRRQTLTLIILIMVIAVITLLMILRIVNHYKPTPQFMFLTERELSDNYEVKALIIRDETVFRSPSAGAVRSFFADGSKVAKNEELAYIIPQTEDDTLTGLQNIENEIINYQYELLESDNNVGARQIDQETSARIREVISNVYSEILNNRFSDISTDEAALHTILSERNERLRNYNFNDERLEELLNRYHELEEELSAKSNIIESTQSGIYIRSYDGLEDRLNPENMENMTAAELDQFLKTAPQGRLDLIVEVQKNDPLYCLTNSINQYFAFFIPAGKSTQVQVSSPIEGISDEGISLTDGLVVRSEETDFGTMIIMKCNTALERLANRRVVDLSLKVNKQSGLRVPISALVNYAQGNLEADIYVENSGFIKQTAVKIIAANANYALIESTENAEIPIGSSTMVILNPKDVQIGDSATGIP